MLIAALAIVVAYIIFICWKIWLVLALNDVSFFSPSLLVSSAVIIVYAVLLAGVVLLIRSHGKHAQRHTGKERRRQKLLRYALNFLMAAPVIGLVTAFLIRVLGN